nr:MgtC/SapB family protein [Methylobacterium sp. ap11]
MSLYVDVQARGGNADPLCVIQGLVEAIGFIDAGTVFVDKDDAERTVRNLTTAASVRLAASAGIVAGAAQFTLLAAAMGVGQAILVLITPLKRFGLARADGEE